MLGYGIGIPETGSAYGLADPDDVFKLTHVTCSGTELTLLDCLSRLNFSSQCTYTISLHLAAVYVFSIQSLNSGLAEVVYQGM